MRVVIVTGGSKPSKERILEFLKDDDYIIGSDSGCNCLKEYDIIPNLILGDFDSIEEEVLSYFKEKNVEIMKYPSDKDYSDTHLAYSEGVKRGGEEFLIFGATGSRLDHTLGNIGLLLIGNKNNTDVTIIDNNNRIYLKDESFIVKGNFEESISFHALSEEVKGFTIEGARYNIKNYNLSLLEPRAISNEFLDDEINVSFESGKILVLHSFD